MTTALQRSDLSELFTHWSFEPYQALDVVIAVVLIVISAWALRKLVRWLLTILGRRRFLPTQLIEAARRESIAELAILDAHLARHAFVGGAAFSMGDLGVGSCVWRWMALPIARPALPHLQRWFDALASRPAYRRVVMQPLC